MFNEWWLARNKGRNTGEEFIYGYPTELTGIEKKEGCIHYQATDKSCRWVDGGRLVTWNMGWYLTPRTCKKIFGHCPKKGELLCVTKTRKGWKSEKIELEFS